MAERRMFAKSVVCSDRFLDMPASARELFFQLGMQTDDDGFVSNPRTVARSCGASKDDLALLAAKGFVTIFDSGVLHLTDFATCNRIRKDRYVETAHLEEKSLLNCGGNQTVCVGLPSGVPSGNQTGAQYSVGEDSLVESSLERREGARAARFTPPTPEEVSAYAAGKGHASFDATRFVSYYESNGWRVGRNPMRSWRAAVDNWARRDAQASAPKTETGGEYDADF